MRVRARRRAAERAAARAGTALGVARAQAARTSVERADATAALEGALAELTDLDAVWVRLLAVADEADRTVAAAVKADAGAAAARAVERATSATAEQEGARCGGEHAAAVLAAAEADEQLRLIEGRVGAPELVIDLPGAEHAVAALDRVADVLAQRAAALADAVAEGQQSVSDAEQAVGAARALHEGATSAQTLTVDALHRAELALRQPPGRAPTSWWAHTR